MTAASGRPSNLTLTMTPDADERTQHAMTAILRLWALLAIAMFSTAGGGQTAEITTRKGRGLRMGRGAGATYCGIGVVDGRRVSVFDDGKLMPVLTGGDGPNDPPKPDPNAPAGTPGAPAAQPDLAGLEKVINDAKTNGQTEATATVLKALGFDKLEDATNWVKAKRDADTAQLTELERREQAAAEKEAAATRREQDAAAKALRADIRAALLTANAPGANVADLVDLVKVPANADEAAITAAVEAVKTKFPALFTGTATPPPNTPPAPSGLPGGTPPPGTPPADPLEAGRKRAAALKAGRTGATQKDLIDQFSPRASPLATTA